VRFLADESCDYRVVSALRSAGHDVVAIVEQDRGAADQQVFARARREQRILLTEDKDFGQLAVAAEMGPAGGLILIRCPEEARGQLAQSISLLVEHEGERLHGSIVVWTPRRVRLRQISERPS